MRAPEWPEAQDAPDPEPCEFCAEMLYPNERHECQCCGGPICQCLGPQCDGCGEFSGDKGAGECCDEREHMFPCRFDEKMRRTCHFWPDTDAPKDPER